MRVFNTGEAVVGDIVVPAFTLDFMVTESELLTDWPLITRFMFSVDPADAVSKA